MKTYPTAEQMAELQRKHEADKPEAPPVCKDHLWARHTDGFVRCVYCDVSKQGSTVAIGNAPMAEQTKSDGGWEAQRVAEIEKELSGWVSSSKVEEEVLAKAEFLLARLRAAEKERETAIMQTVRAVGGAFRYGANECWREDWMWAAKRYCGNDEPVWNDNDDKVIAEARDELWQKQIDALKAQNAALRESLEECSVYGFGEHPTAKLQALADGPSLDRTDAARELRRREALGAGGS